MWASKPKALCAASGRPARMASVSGAGNSLPTNVWMGKGSPKPDGQGTAWALFDNGDQQTMRRSIRATRQRTSVLRSLA
jgi:hypothetical protein